MEEDKEKNVSETPKEENKELEETDEETKETEEDEDEELFADEEDFDEEQGDTWGRVRDFVQDNLRVILSVLIVALIAVGIYNYSQKPTDQSDQSVSKIDEIIGNDNVNVVNDNSQPSTEVTVKDQQAQDKVVVKDQKANANNNADAKEVANTDANAPKETAEQAQPEVAPQKTDAGIKVTAEKGDGMTILARKALKEHVASGQDGDLSKEQKIYVEDYLRKHVASGRVLIGTTQEFSDSLIGEAISKAKQLNDRQLQNLKRYSARVSNL